MISTTITALSLTTSITQTDSSNNSRGNSVLNCTTCTPTSVSVCVRSMRRDRERRRQQCADAPGCLSTSPLPHYIYLFIPPVRMYYNIKLYPKPICLTVFTIYSTHTVAYTYTLCTVLVTSVLQQHEPTLSLPISFYLLPLLQLLLLLLVFFLGFFFDCAYIYIQYIHIVDCLLE